MIFFIKLIQPVSKPKFKPKVKPKFKPKFKIKMPQQTPLEKTLGKRKYAESFDPSTFDDDRYGQHISADFFDTHTGHGVFVISENSKININIQTK